MENSNLNLVNPKEDRDLNKDDIFIDTSKSEVSKINGSYYFDENTKTFKIRKEDPEISSVIDKNTVRDYNINDVRTSEISYNNSNINRGATIGINNPLISDVLTKSFNVSGKFDYNLLQVRNFSENEISDTSDATE